VSAYLHIATLAGFALVYLAFAGLLQRIAFSGALAFATFGLLVGPHVVGLLELNADPDSYRLLVELTLAAVLFGDAAQADVGVLRAAYRAPLRLLAVSLPLTIGAGLVLAIGLFPDFSWIEAALLATVLAPTDAALGKAVVVDKRVPARIRETLNVESGLNDGICVPVLLLFLLLATGMPDGGAPAALVRFALEEIGVGALVGSGVAVIAHLLLDRTLRRGWTSREAIPFMASALALLAFALAPILGGSGFIAAFIGGFVWGRLRRRAGGPEVEFDEALGGLLGFVTWVIFGGIVVAPVLLQLDLRTFLYAIASLTMVRMVPVALALGGLPFSWPEKLFIGWFGPRGLASIVFVIMVLQADLADDARIAAVAATTILLSVVLHGLTAAPLAARFGQKEPR
jgi:NhaP-type Na+/H+ or K+/H+ antiporter